MKKTAKALSLILGLLIMLSFSSCKNLFFGGSSSDITEGPFIPQDASSLWGKMYETMNNSDSYTVNQTRKLTYYYYGNKFEQSFNSTGILTKDGMWIQATSEQKCDELSLKENYDITSAYYDGKMYSHISDGRYNQNFCSAMSFDEFLESEEESFVDGTMFADCTYSEFTENEDGSWSLSFSGYTKKTLNKMLKSYGFTNGMFGADILDMSFTATADENFNIKSTYYEFEFDIDDRSDVIPVFSVKMDYSDFNNSSIDSEKLKPEEYTEAENLDILDKVTDGIKKIQDAVTGEATIDKKVYSIVDGKKGKESVEKDSFTYGTKNGSYYFDLITEINGQKMYNVFENGYQTFTANGEKNHYSMSDAEAKLGIDSYIDSAYYNSIAVTDIEKKGDGVYLFKVADFDVNSITLGFEETGIAAKSGTEEITVTFEEDNIKKIESKISIVCTTVLAENNETFTVVIDSTVNIIKADSALKDESV